MSDYGTGSGYQVRELAHPTKLGISDANPLAENVNPLLPGTGWDVIFTPADFNIPLSEFECYHIALNGPVGSSLAVLINKQPWDYVNQGWLNSWDPSQPMLIKAGQSVQFCWNAAFTGPPYNQTANIQPSVTMWLRRPPQDIVGSL